ncbi:hypothetical protein BGZ63DRAFT_381448 [Mariannaea sp. PMI_226]|nr:hypothetical protein BGZ63DRAFT_381448 [Mariannaea sp. PMI_226]
MNPGPLRPIPHSRHLHHPHSNIADPGPGSDAPQAPQVTGAPRPRFLHSMISPSSASCYVCTMYQRAFLS